jgi:adenylate cyclase
MILFFSAGRALRRKPADFFSRSETGLSGLINVHERHCLTLPDSRTRNEVRDSRRVTMPNDAENKNENEDAKGSDIQDMDQLLEQRKNLDTLFQDKFTKVITVMFTDLKGSTSFADKQGDIASRLLVKHYLDIILPAIKTNNGVFIKSIGDGTLSHFDTAQDGLRAAAQIQRGIDSYIMREKPKTPILARIGLHTGRCIMEKNDIFGDVVNTASRFESIADGGAIFISEETYNALSDKSEIYCKFVKTTTLKGKQDVFKVYKAYWNPGEMEAEPGKSGSAAAPAPVAPPSVPLKKIIIFLAIALLLLFMLVEGSAIKRMLFPSSEKRSIQESTDVSHPSDRK